MSDPLEKNNGSENNNGSNKDVRLLLLPEKGSCAEHPLTGLPRAPLQKIFIDDLTKSENVGAGKVRQRVWRVPWFILLMCFMQVRFDAVAPDVHYLFCFRISGCVGFE